MVQDDIVLSLGLLIHEQENQVKSPVGLWQVREERLKQVASLLRILLLSLVQLYTGLRLKSRRAELLVVLIALGK